MNDVAIDLPLVRSGLLALPLGFDATTAEVFAVGVSEAGRHPRTVAARLRRLARDLGPRAVGAVMLPVIEWARSPLECVHWKRSERSPVRSFHLAEVNALLLKPNGLRCVGRLFQPGAPWPWLIVSAAARPSVKQRVKPVVAWSAAELIRVGEKVRAWV